MHQDLLGGLVKTQRAGPSPPPQEVLIQQVQEGPENCISYKFLGGAIAALGTTLVFPLRTSEEIIHVKCLAPAVPQYMAASMTTVRGGGVFRFCSWTSVPAADCVLVTGPVGLGLILNTLVLSTVENAGGEVLLCQHLLGAHHVPGPGMG